MVLLSARGYAVPQIAEIFEVGEDTVRTWLHRYQERGPDGLVDWPRPGRRPKDCLARQIVDTQMHNSPRANGLVQACWTVGLLAAFLAARFRLALSARTIRRHLHASGWRWARPRLDVATHAPRGQRQEDPAAPLKLRLIERALGSPQQWNALSTMQHAPVQGWKRLEPRDRPGGRPGALWLAVGRADSGDEVADLLASGRTDL